MINYNDVFNNFMKDSEVANAFTDAEKEYGELHNNQKLTKENTEPRQINIRQSLIELDKEDSDFLGSLSIMYDYLEPDLTIEDKKELINLINNNDYLKIFNFLDGRMDVDFDYEIHEEEIN